MRAHVHVRPGLLRVPREIQLRILRPLLARRDVHTELRHRRRRGQDERFAVQLLHRVRLGDGREPGRALLLRPRGVRRQRVGADVPKRGSLGEVGQRVVRVARDAGAVSPGDQDADPGLAAAHESHRAADVSEQGHAVHVLQSRGHRRLPSGGGVAEPPSPPPTASPPPSPPPAPPRPPSPPPAPGAFARGGRGRKAFGAFLLVLWVCLAAYACAGYLFVRARARKRWELLEPAELAAPYDAGAVRRGPRRRRGGRARGASSCGAGACPRTGGTASGTPWTPTGRTTPCGGTASDAHALL